MTGRVRIGDQHSLGGQPALTPSHDAILDAAIRCFLPLGYAATSMQAVAKEAGVTVKTVFYQFVGKEALFRAAIAHVWRALPIVQIEPDRLAAATVDVALKQIGYAVADFWSAPLAITLLRMLIAQRQHFPDLTGSFVEADIMPMTTSLITYLERLAKDGLVTNMPEPALAAKQFLGMINEPLLWSRVIGIKSDSATSEEREKVVSEAVGTFLDRYRGKNIKYASE